MCVQYKHVHEENDMHIYLYQTEQIRTLSNLIAKLISLEIILYCNTLLNILIGLEVAATTVICNLPISGVVENYF